MKSKLVLTLHPFRSFSSNILIRKCEMIIIETSVHHRPGVEVIKLFSVLGAQKSCSKHEIQHFDWLIFEY